VNDSPDAGYPEDGSSIDAELFFRSGLRRSGVHGGVQNDVDCGPWRMRATVRDGISLRAGC